MQLCHEDKLDDKDNYFGTFSQQQTTSLGHETPPQWSQQCWTWQVHSSPLVDSKQESKSVREVPHLAAWWVTTKATCRTFLVNFSLSLKCGVSYHAKGICVWCSIWADGRPKKKKNILKKFKKKLKIRPCPFGLQPFKYMLKLHQQFRFGPGFIMFKVNKGFKGNRYFRLLFKNWSITTAST